MSSQQRCAEEDTAVDLSYLLATAASEGLDVRHLSIDSGEDSSVKETLYCFYRGEDLAFSAILTETQQLAFS